MSVLGRDEFFQRIQSRIGETSDDESIAFLEDVTDTYNDMETRASGGGEDWKTKFENNDKQWREKYKSRFFSMADKAKDDQEENVKLDGEKTSFEDLFKRREG